MTNKIKYSTYTIGDKEVTLPEFNETVYTTSLRRKTRRLSEEEAAEEIFWLIIEEHLTADQIAVIDSLTFKELEELMALFAEEQDLAKK